MLERRNLTRRNALFQRVLAEFTEMPGLSLTLDQASRLFGIQPDACQRILSEHIKSGQLRLARRERYVLASGESA